VPTSGVSTPYLTMWDALEIIFRLVCGLFMAYVGAYVCPLLGLLLLPKCLPGHWLATTRTYGVVIHGHTP
jgi:hypothetical protein